MGSRLQNDAQKAADAGGPPMPLPMSLDDLGPVLARWPLMLMYDAPSGDLWWRYIVESNSERYMDPREYVAGQVRIVSNRARRFVRIDGFTVEAARIVWLLHHNTWPPERRLRRKDGDYLNDRIENLWVAAEDDPRPHLRLPGTSKLRGMWQAYVHLPDGGRKTIGQKYATEEEAAAARAAWLAGADLIDGDAPTRGRRRKRPLGVARSYDRWQAYVRLSDGRQKHLGTFRTEVEAIAARKAWDDAADLI